MTNRLLRYEAALVRRSFGDAFGRKRDQLLLLVMLALAALWLRDRIAKGIVQPLPPVAFWLALLAFVPAFAWQRYLVSRLDWLAEHSVVAEAALQPRKRCAYLGVAHVVLAMPIFAAALWLGLCAGRPILTVGLAALAGLGGAMAGYLPLGSNVDRGGAMDAPTNFGSPITGRRAALHIILARQTRSGRNPLAAAMALVAFVFGLTLALAIFGRSQSEPLPALLPLLPLSVSLILTSRIDAGLVSFLPFAGYGPAYVGGAIILLPLACGVAAAMAVTLAWPPHVLITLVLMMLCIGVAIVAGLARAWLYPGRSKRSVDLQLQVEFAGLALIGFLLPPLAALALPWRLACFYREASSKLWMQP